MSKTYAFGQLLANVALGVLLAPPPAPPAAPPQAPPATQNDEPGAPGAPQAAPGAISCTRMQSTSRTKPWNLEISTTHLDWEKLNEVAKDYKLRWGETQPSLTGLFQGQHKSVNNSRLCLPSQLWMQNSQVASKLMKGIVYVSRQK